MKTDARIFQANAQMIFLLVGAGVLHWDVRPLWALAVVAVCLFTQWFFDVRITHRPFNMPSALITAFSLCLLFRADALWVHLLAGFLSIASKFIISHNHKHFFNPSNFGICFTILLTGQGWISPSIWGQEWKWVLLILLCGFTVLFFAKVLHVTLAFLFTFGLLHAARLLLYMNWDFDVWLHIFSSGSLFVFSFFMITDPAVLPKGKLLQMGFASLTALLAWYLQAFAFIPTGPLWALFIISFFLPFLHASDARLIPSVKLIMLNNKNKNL
ncbi:MAG: RnfABCDGE type electron transport complex subunit D [Bacteroidia bacterium]|nr:RnfABCDGE type electron transport complex subunit D [Bacteroidia bacterium]